MWLVLGAVVALFTAVIVGSLYWAIDQWCAAEREDSPQKVEPASASNNAFSAPSASRPDDDAKTNLIANLGEGFVVADAVNRAWEAWQRAPGAVWTAGLLMLIADCNNNGSGSDNSDTESFAAAASSAGDVALLQSEMDWLKDPMVLAVVLGVGALCYFGLVAFRAWLVPGVIRMNFALLHRHEGGFAELFSGADRMFAVFGWRVMRMALMSLVVPVFMVPVVVVGVAVGLSGDDSQAFEGVGFIALIVLILVLMFALWVVFIPCTWLTEFFIVVDGHDPITAFKLSSRAAQGNRVSLWLFALGVGLVQTLLGLSGFLLLCIGALFTLPAARGAADLMWMRGFLVARYGLADAEPLVDS